MLRPVPTLVAVLLPFSTVAGLRADAPETRDQLREPVAVRAAAASGGVHGVVRDQDGRGVAGVSIVAMGATVSAAESDRAGRFVLTLRPGFYLLRATRPGYVSTFREPVRVSASAPLERNITLVRQSGTPMAEAVAVAASDPGPHAHTPLAWRLRQMRRVILRDETIGPLPEAAAPESGAAAGNLFDRAVASSVRAASLFFSDTPFDGQVNWMTTGWVDAAGARPSPAMTGSVAYLAIGAPIEGHGFWTVRGALASGEPSSWVLLGEFESAAHVAHAVTAGVSYGAFRPRAADPSAGGVPVGEARTAGAVYLFDRWKAGPGLDVHFGLRVDAYDYLDRSPVVSPRIGARVAVTSRAALTMEGLSHAVAPGTAEFQPPSTAGLWLPPDRSFAPIRTGAPLRAERVRELAVGVEYTFGPADAGLTVALQRFRQSSQDQLVTIFGSGPAGAGHYLSGAVGDLAIDGWTSRVSGAWSPHVQGTFAYSYGLVTWDTPGWRLRRVRQLAASAARDGHEVLHDLTASVAAEIPMTATRMSLAARASTGFSPAAGADRRAGARFAFEVRQALPYQPWRGGSLDVLVGIRNLYRDLDDAGSLYDELLTVSPPLRFVGGIQVRF